MTAPTWLTARPVAHRGLHDRARGRIENMPSAIDAAIAGRFAIEVDLQISGDGEAMVHHDDVLGRLNDGRGALAMHSAAELQALAFRDTAERMMTLSDLCARVAGRVPLVLELKSLYNNDPRVVTRTATVLRNYAGPAAVMSFDPFMVERALHDIPDRPRGIVAEDRYDSAYWAKLTNAQREDMTGMRHAMRTRPDFVAYNVNDLPSRAAWAARNVFDRPLLTWTVRTSAQRDKAAREADQMIFEGFVPTDAAP